MKVGINEVIIHGRSDGNRQRELNLLPLLLRRLEQLQHDVLLYMAKDMPYALMSTLIGYEGYFRLKQTPLPTMPTYKRTIMGEFYWANQVKNDHVDLFHTSYYPVPRVETPTVLTVNDLRFLHLPESYTRTRLLFLRLFVPISLRRATRIIAISQNTKDDIVSHFGLAEDIIDVVHISLNIKFKPTTRTARLAKIQDKYNLPNRFILYVGHLEPRKNLGRLVEAYGQLQNDIAQHLVILGKPNYRYEKIYRKADQSGYASKIHFTGYVDDVDLVEIYTLADLLAFPSLHEGFGVPILEAMACATPVVTSNIAALPEVAGEAAILVDPYNTSSIAEGIAQVLNDTTLYQSLVNKGLERIKEFNPEQAAAKVIQTYEKAISATSC